nr:alpha-L-fucosidase [Microlunatus panaciterrae]
MIAPSAGQLAWQQLELGFFCHFGLNTFHGLEWSDGTLPASSFDPVELDARQWVRTAREAGARYFILTAKHHDGFCLWPTATTDYSVASSPWRDGQGDVVREVAEACAAEQLPLGLYLSPWDRNAECYPDAEAYDRFYLAQLRELCSNYGPLVELWFDGAGSQGREYDWSAISALIDELQPQAMVFNMGRPTIRWVGNEDGLAADPVRYVVDRTDFSQYTVETVSLDTALYLPPECDVSLRRGWFWAEHDEPKELDHLLSIYYHSVGMGANLLLNAPPDNRGLIPNEDVARLHEWRAELDRRFSDPMEATVTPDGDAWLVDFGRPVRLDHLELAEDHSGGQRVSGHRVLTDRTTLCSGMTIGHRRLHVFAPLETQFLRVELDGDQPLLSSVRGYLTGVSEIGEAAYLAPTEAPDPTS